MADFYESETDTDLIAEEAVEGMENEEMEAEEVEIDPATLAEIRQATLEASGLDPALNLQTPADFPTDEAEVERQRLHGLRALYGEDFPLAREDGEEAAADDWVSWGKNLFDRHLPSLQRRMHHVTQLRLFREGRQWITSDGVNQWNEPPKPRNSIRVVHNLMSPALDQRANLLSEQRPGFRTRPRNQDPESLKKAEARQLALEYQHDQQGMSGLIREASYWNGTDGAAFWLTYWDADAGPWHEELSETEMNPETGTPKVVKRYPLGDVVTRTYRTEQVAVSANATATRKPWYIVLKETIPLSEAVAFHGDRVSDEGGGSGSGNDTSFSQIGGTDQYGIRQDDLLDGQETVDRYIIFCEKSEMLPNGLTVVIVGDRCMMVSELLCGKVPVIRIPDGGTDPAYFPRPEALKWRDHQIRINAVLSKWIESVAQNTGGRYMYRARAVNLADLIGGAFSGIEVRTSGPVDDALKPIQPFSVAGDAKELLALAVSAFEEVSGYNAASRGGASAGASGRAILANREGLERIYAPGVNAMARAMTEWAEITMAWLRWGYDMERQVPIVGKGRTDLALALSSETFEPDSQVEIDPETLMPMPNAYKQFLLDDYLEKGIIDVKEYRQRMPFSFIGSMDRPADQHTARAKRIVALILSGTPYEQLPPVKWQDNESVHQDVLESEIILRDELDPNVIAVAEQRWLDLANQFQAKNPAGAQPEGGPPQAGGKSAFKPGPEKMPLLGMNPGMAAAPQAEAQGFEGERQAGALFDRTRVN